MLPQTLFAAIFAVKLCYVNGYTGNSIEKLKESDRKLKTDLTKEDEISDDEEYEDLRAELMAYHTALDKLSPGFWKRQINGRPCREMGGICISYKKCSGYRFLTDVPGCEGHPKVCCFTKNNINLEKFKKMLRRDDQEEIEAKEMQSVPPRRLNVQRNRKQNPKDENYIKTNKIGTSKEITENESHSKEEVVTQVTPRIPLESDSSSEENNKKRIKKIEESGDISTLGKNGNSIALIVKTT